MKNAMVCVAGVDLDGGACVRPLPPNNQHNWPEQLVQRGVRPGAIVSQQALANAHPADFPHRTEDTVVAGELKVRSQMTASEFLDTLLPLADHSLNGIFGENLEEDKYVVEKTRCRSLGSIAVAASDVGLEDSYGKVRCSFVSHGSRHFATATDLELVKARESGKIESMAKRLRRFGSRQIILRIGLARAWPGPHNEFNPPRCYMQINGVIAPE